MFGKRLKNLRENAGFTQEQLGKKLNVVKSNISMYENGTRIPNADILEQLSKIFDVSIDYLLGKTDVKKYESPYDDELEKVLFSKAKELNTEEKKAILNVINAIKKDVDSKGWYIAYFTFKRRNFARWILKL